MNRVLLIDDDENLAQPLAEYFNRYKLDLVSALHPEEGLQRLARREIQSRSDHCRP